MLLGVCPCCIQDFVIFINNPIPLLITTLDRTWTPLGLLEQLWRLHTLHLSYIKHFFISCYGNRLFGISLRFLDVDQTVLGHHGVAGLWVYRGFWRAVDILDGPKDCFGLFVIRPRMRQLGLRSHLGQWHLRELPFATLGQHILISILIHCLILADGWQAKVPLRLRLRLQVLSPTCQIGLNSLVAILGHDQGHLGVTLSNLPATCH